ncbi:MAG: amidohydrolase family protein [Chloroflexi bacterium]|nr:amidohydrolase family protein [Chloroflexota bacterium]MYK34031.1 amidohydrolase family protein [Chloroflexota bacterium]
MYDLLIKNGRVADGSGMPSFIADVGIVDGRVADVGRLSGPAQRTIDAEGRVVAPGFIDNHCHFDAQVTWDPLCTFSPQHGVTSVIFGNCSLTLAPVKPEDHDALAMMLSRVEAIPMESLQEGIPWEWTTFGGYLDYLDQRLGVNAGALVGHSAVRRWVMGDESFQRAEATPAEMEEMKQLVRDSIRQGALGLSFNRNSGHMDLLGRPIPGIVPPVEELYELATALRDVGAGVVQCGAAYPLEIRDGFATKLGEHAQRPVVYNQIVYHPSEPDRWQRHLDIVERGIAEGKQVYPVINPRPQAQRFTMRNAQIFDRMPTWREVMLGSVEEKAAAFRDPAVREKLRAEAVDGKNLPSGALPVTWERIFITRTLKERNSAYKGMSIAEMAEAQGKDVIDGFLDLVLDEDLGTGMQNSQAGADGGIMGRLVASPYTVIGLSDAGAHVVFEAGYGYSTLVLGKWVREEGALSLEEAVRKLSFMQASLFGLHDRGLLRPGFAADVVVFDPDTVGAEEPDEVNDLPGGLMRLRQKANGVDYTIVNGEVLLEDGEHTGAYPGRTLRSRAPVPA